MQGCLVGGGKSMKGDPTLPMGFIPCGNSSNEEGGVL